MSYRIELIDEATSLPMLVLEITDAIMRGRGLHTDDSLTSHILRSLSLWVNPDEARRCAQAAIAAPGQAQRLPVKRIQSRRTASDTPEAELDRLREQLGQAQGTARRWRADYEEASRQYVEATAEIDRLKTHLGVVSRQANTMQAAAQAQIAALQDEGNRLRQRHEQQQSAISAAKSESRSLQRRTDELETERDALRRRLDENKLLVAERDFK